MIINITSTKNFVESIAEIDSTKIKSITIIDNSEYVSGLHNNGGCYGYSTRFSRGEFDGFCVEYGTTADLPYCSIRGRFGDCCNCYYCSEGECLYEPITASFEEVIGSCVMALVTHEKALDTENLSDVWVELELAEQQDA